MSSVQQRTKLYNMQMILHLPLVLLIVVVLIYFVSCPQGWCQPKMVLALVVGVLCVWGRLSVANPEAKRLYDDLLSNYNRLIRPVGNNSDRLTVKMGLRLSQLIDVVSTLLILQLFPRQNYVATEIYNVGARSFIPRLNANRVEI